MNLNEFYELFGITKVDCREFYIGKINITSKIRSVDKLYYSILNDKLKVNGGVYFHPSIFNKVIPKVLELVEDIKVKDLQHFKDVNIGLWATDKEPRDKTDFWEIKS